jgi:hypothetical protein
MVALVSLPGSGAQSAPAAAAKPADSAATAAAIHPPAPQFSLSAGKTFVYGAQWRLFNAGTATIHIDAAEGKPHIIGTADAAGAVGLLYHVHDTFDTMIDPRSFCSLSLHKHTEEGFRRLETSIRFEYPRNKAVLEEVNLKNKSSKREENDIPTCVTDVIAGIYYLASQKLEPGTAFVFPLNDGGKTATVRAEVEAREEVKTPVGNYKAIRVAAEAIDGPRQGKGKIWVWYSDDGAHIPVQMRAKLFWGTLNFQLQRIDQPRAATAGENVRSSAAAAGDDK